MATLGRSVCAKLYQIFRPETVCQKQLSEEIFRPVFLFHLGTPTDQMQPAAEMEILKIGLPHSVLLHPVVAQTAPSQLVESEKMPTGYASLNHYQHLLELLEPPSADLQEADPAHHQAITGYLCEYLPCQHQSRTVHCTY